MWENWALSPPRPWELAITSLMRDPKGCLSVTWGNCTRCLAKSPLPLWSPSPAGWQLASVAKSSRHEDSIRSFEDGLCPRNPGFEPGSVKMRKPYTAKTTTAVFGGPPNRYGHVTRGFPPIGANMIHLSGRYVVVVYPIKPLGGSGNNHL